MKRGALLGIKFGVAATLALWLRPVFMGPLGFEALFSAPTALLTDVVWVTVITALLGAAIERTGGLPAGSSDAEPAAAGLDDTMQEFDG